MQLMQSVQCQVIPCMHMHRMQNSHLHCLIHVPLRIACMPKQERAASR